MPQTLPNPTSEFPKSVVELNDEAEWIDSYCILHEELWAPEGRSKLRLLLF